MQSLYIDIMQPEFHAWAGSEVHLYCETVYADCNEFSGFQMQRNAASNTTNNNEQSNSIEIQFKKNKSIAFLTVSPNPSNGIFQVQLIDNDESSNIKTISIFDMTGRKIKIIEINNKSCQLDLSMLPKGIYFLQASDLNNQYNKKIIIN